MTKRVLHVVTNVSHYTDPSRATGLWLSELTHAYQEFEKAGLEQQIISPKGGLSPLDPRSLTWLNRDKTTRAWLNSPERMDLLSNTKRPEQINPEDYHAIYFTGGHGVMWDFPNSLMLQELTREIYENGGIVSSVCHGFCGLLNVRVSDGSLLVAEHKLTGFSWREEVLAGVSKIIPYNAEEQMMKRGALFEKAWLPFMPNVVVDGRLLTGQNPQSAKATAKQILSII